MSNPAQLSSIEAESETLFAENTSTFATLRLPILGPVDVSKLVHSKIDSQRATQYRQEGTPWIPGVMGGEVTTKFWLTGHGSTTSGATSLTALETLLGNVIGNATVSAASGTTLTGGTASIPLTTASGTFAAGSLCRVGTLNDGRGNGQFAAIATHTTTNLTLLTAIDGSPTAADVLYSAVNLYPFEIPTSSAITTYRFRCLTANLCYELHGVYPKSWKLSGLSTGETPTIEITWGVAWWKYTASGTFPSTVTGNTDNAAVVAGGSLFVQDNGTVTRNKLSSRSFSLEVTMGVEPLKGPGGVNAAQEIIGVRRTVDQYKVTVMLDADSTTATPVLDGYWTAGTFKHVLYTLSTTAGSAVGIYMPKLCITGARPVQKMDGNIQRYVVEGMAYTGGTTTNDLTLSAVRIGMA